MQITPGTLLQKVNNPADIKKLSREELQQLCDQLRQYIIDVVSVHGGHFGASLGVVELTVALHYIYNTPYDQLVWDVGHQAYGHKILTGRRDNFSSNRKYNGLSGFPKRSESEYDSFGVGHSSTSISAALGMAMTAKYKKENDRKVVAVIGDGAMTAGLAFEGLNHAGVADADMLIVLNDNCMSIDSNVGALKEYLTDITTSPTYNKFRDELWNLLGKLPVGKNFSRDMASKMEASMKGMVSKSSNLFEALNIRYFGPIDGHNITKLVDTLKDLREMPGPKLLHIITVKGKGYELAEKDQTKWHAPGLFDKITGEIQKKKFDILQPPKYQDVFGQTIIELAEKNEKIFGITPAMPSGSSLKYMMEKMPDRAFDVGIAEQHAVTLSGAFYFSLFFFIWNLIYFLYHFVTKSQRQQFDTLKLESMVKELELKTIKAHINPHFIFNSLNSIRALIDENPGRARNAITELSNILRSSMQTDKMEAVPFERELNIVKDYLALENMRFEDRLKVEYEIDEDTLDQPVPPMMLQTLVENAIKHGISKQISGGTVKVVSDFKDNYHELAVQNTGKLNGKMNGEGFGLPSTLSRLSLLYGEKAIFNIKQLTPDIVEARVLLPL